jgi:hypothetical protein
MTLAVTGDTEQANPTAELKLLSDVIVIIDVVEAPAVVVADAGKALKLKSFTLKA